MYDTLLEAKNDAMLFNMSLKKPIYRAMSYRDFVKLAGHQINTKNFKKCKILPRSTYKRIGV